MKKLLKIVGIVLLAIVLLAVILVAVLLVKNYIQSRKPLLTEDYYTWLQPEEALERKYTGLGDYDVSHTVLDYGDDTIRNIRIWYPTELERSARAYPAILVVNASNTAALNYEPFFARLASWGFVVVGNDDRQTGTGLSASQTLDYLLEQNASTGSLFFEKIDTERLGIVGYSQGGAGAVRAVTEYDSSGMFKVLFTGSAAHTYLSQMWGGYDPAKVSIPWFMTAGTGTSDDTGVSDITAEWAGVAPLASLKENYDKMAEDVLKIRARATGAEHEEMLVRTDGYMTAWMLYLLQNDTEAGQVFLGEDAEILHNANWQDVEKSR